MVYFLFFFRGWLGVSLFIYLFICWGSEVGVFLLCCHSIAPCTSQGDISASAICHLWRFIFSYRYVGRLYRLLLAAFVAYPIALQSALLHRGYSQRLGGSWLYPRAYFPLLFWFIFGHWIALFGFVSNQLFL